MSYIASKDDYAAHVVSATVSFFTESKRILKKKSRNMWILFPKLKKQIELLESIPGIGLRTSFQF